MENVTHTHTHEKCNRNRNRNDMHWRFVWITLIHAKLTIQTRIKPREQTIHVCTKTRFHIQLDYYLWYFLRGYDLVVYIQCLWPFKVAGFRNSMHRSCISLFSHKFSATSKIVPFSVGVCIFVFICFVMGIRRERPRCPLPTPFEIAFAIFWRNKVMNLSIWQ